MSNIKSAPLAVKAVGADDGLAEGQFEAIVSVFGNEDSYGDVVMPGAFKADIERWEGAGDSIPVIWSHDWADPFSHLGTVIKAEERPEGLWVRAQIHDLDTNPKARQVYNLLKGRRVKQFSFAYDVIDAGYGSRESGEVYELRQLKVHEVGPCLLGVNQETQLLAVKAASLATEAKAGRVLSAKNYDSLREAHAAIGVVLAAAEPEKAQTPQSSESPDPDETDEPSQVDEPVANEEEPAGANSEEPPVKSAPRRALAVARITNLS